MDSMIDEGRLGEEAAARVLDRAAELEALRGSSIDVADLRSAAIEAGIPLEVFERALDEVRRGNAARAWRDPVLEGGQGRPSLLSWLRRSTLLGVGALFAGASAALEWFGVDGSPAALFAGMLAFLTACALAAVRRRRTEVLAFEMDLAALWAGLAAAWMVANPTDAAAILIGTSLVAGVIGVFGGAFVSLPPPLDRLPE